MDQLFARFATATARATGSPLAFICCVAAVVLWAVSGPFFGFSETWQLVINTGTTIVTFLMVFLIQNTQNRDGAALQAKLDEIILFSDAENDFVGIEQLRELGVSDVVDLRYPEDWVTYPSPDLKPAGISIVRAPMWANPSRHWPDLVSDSQATSLGWLSGTHASPISRAIRAASREWSTSSVMRAQWLSSPT